MRSLRSFFSSLPFILWSNRIAKWLFVLQIPIAELTGLKKSVPYLVFLSLWALVASHWTVERAVEGQMETKRDTSES